VNLQLVFTDGHTVQVCTHDRPACPNQTPPAVNGSTASAQFNLTNQLRSSSRRYILFIRFDAALMAEAPVQTLRLDPQVAMLGLPGSASGTGTLTSAEVQITPRDPDAQGYIAATGSLSISSSHGEASGRIDGRLSGGPSGSPVGITGTFACSH
jgi:hypothetical protein